MRPSRTSAGPCAASRSAKTSKGHDINLGNILQAFENSQLTQLKGTIDRKDEGRLREDLQGKPYQSAIRATSAVDKPYLRPQVPTEPASRIINFDPKANWPL